MAFLPRDKERGIWKSGKRPYFVAQARDFGGHVGGRRIEIGRVGAERGYGRF